MEEGEGHGFAMLQLPRGSTRLHTHLKSFSSSWISTSIEESEATGMWQHHFNGFSEPHSAAPGCGVAIQAFGDANSSYVQTALKTINLFVAQSVTPGWCWSAPDLTKIPVTLNTNLPPDQIDMLLLNVNQGTTQASGMNTSKFDDLNENQNSNSSIQPKLGPAIYRWYHCQIFVHAPYDLMLYMDADTTICTAAGVAELFRDAAKNSWDLALQESLFEGGCGMTRGNCTYPHPPSVKSPADLDSWSNFKEANAGVVLLAAGKPSVQKFAQGWCSHQRQAFQMDVLGDQYAFRSSLWEHRSTLKIQIFRESRDEVRDNLTANRICRYSFASKEDACSYGCTVLHIPWLQQ